MYRSDEMHVFADSNREVYAVTCFGRLTYDDGSVTFLFGKSKVCPMSGVLTIPRLELVTASSVTLHLICNNSRTFCVLVDSRLAEIHESSCVEN